MLIKGWKYLTYFLILLIACSSSAPSGSRISGYALTKPVWRTELPSILHEVSGVTVIDSATIACIQDENGIIFLYDLSRNSIVKEFYFHIDGDYEGVTRVGNTLYVLRSDGMLFEIDNYSSPEFQLDSIPTGIPASNNEGLCYDADNNCLLIAVKGKIGKGPELKDKRVVYRWDVKTNRLGNEPAYDFDLAAINKYASEHHKEESSKNKKGSKKQPFDIKLRTSAICIHPVTKKLFLLSASDHMIFVFNSDGSLFEMERLDASLFNKAEGITFLDNGDMLITNEGQNQQPTLMRFDYSGS